MKHEATDAASLALCAGGPCAGTHAAAAAAGIPASVEAVSLDVSVLDAHRHPVVGLKAEDFSILEDGRPRPIVAFAAVDVPAPVIAASPSTPDIPVAGGQASASASLTSLADTRGRLIGLIVPSHHFFERLRGAFEGIAMTVVERMSDGDVATVIVPGTPATPLTSDRAALLTAIHSRPDVDTASCDPVLLNAIADFAERVGPLSTRRKLLFFIGGMIALTTRDACAASVNAARARMFHALRLERVGLHPGPEWLGDAGERRDRPLAPRVPFQRPA